jgi:hypothetical protein
MVGVYLPQTITYTAIYGVNERLSASFAATTMSQVSYFTGAKKFVAKNTTFNTYVCGTDGE